MFDSIAAVASAPLAGSAAVLLLAGLIVFRPIHTKPRPRQ